MSEHLPRDDDRHPWIAELDGEDELPLEDTVRGSVDHSERASPGDGRTAAGWEESDPTEDRWEVGHPAEEEREPDNHPPREDRPDQGGRSVPGEGTVAGERGRSTRRRGRDRAEAPDAPGGSEAGSAPPPAGAVGVARRRARSDSGERRPRTPLEQPRDRFRVLVVSALGTVLCEVLAMIVLAALAGLTAGAGVDVRALLTASVPLWLAAHQVPLVLSGAPLGVLPLVPTVAVVWFVAGRSAEVTRRLGGRWREDCSVVIATFTGATASAAVLATALPTGPVQTTPWSALLGAGVVTAIGAVIGALREAGPPSWWAGAPSWARSGLAGARTGAAGLAAEGALLVLVALVVDVERVRASVASAGPGFGASIGITLLSIGYLPNAGVAAVSWVVGPGISIGTAVASPMMTVPGPIPGLPLAAALPALHPPSWTSMAFVLPVLVGLLVGFRCRRTRTARAERLRAVAVAAGLVAVGAGALAWALSGRLGGGPFDPVELSGLATGAAVFGWLGVPAAVVVLLPAEETRLR